MTDGFAVAMFRNGAAWQTTGRREIGDALPASCARPAAQGQHCGERP